MCLIFICISVGKQAKCQTPHNWHFFFKLLTLLGAIHIFISLQSLIQSTILLNLQICFSYLFLYEDLEIGRIISSETRQPYLNRNLQVQKLKKLRKGYVLSWSHMIIFTIFFFFCVCGEVYFRFEPETYYKNWNFGSIKLCNTLLPDSQIY